MKLPPKEYYPLPKIADEWKCEINDLFYYARQGALKLSFILVDAMATVECIDFEKEGGYFYSCEANFPQWINGCYDFPDSDFKLSPKAEGGIVSLSERMGEEITQEDLSKIYFELQLKEGCQLFPERLVEMPLYNLQNIYIRQLETDGFGCGWIFSHERNSHWFYRLSQDYKVYKHDIVITATEKKRFECSCDLAVADMPNPTKVKNLQRIIRLLLDEMAKNAVIIEGDDERAEFVLRKSSGELNALKISEMIQALANKRKFDDGVYGIGKDSIGKIISATDF